MTEFELIDFLTKDAPRVAKGLICGIGDDCAVIEADYDRVFLVTTDALIEDAHFKTSWTDLKTLGRKALAVNLSDIAAMGGVPLFYLVSIGLPSESAQESAKKIYLGLKEMAALYNVILIGGDTAASNKGIVISITAIGEAKRDECLYRRGAKEGDAIYVTGTIGGAALGLACLRKGLVDNEAKPFIALHTDPIPRIAEGRFVAGLKMASAMIDISDGLALDCAHIADASSVGFEIDAAKIPRRENFERAAERLSMDPVKTQLSGGEDYELLFTITAEKVSAFESALKKRAAGCPITRIGIMNGELDKGRALDAKGKDVTPEKRGFDHFR